MDNTTIYEFLQEKSVTPTGPGSYSDSTEMSNALKVFKKNSSKVKGEKDVNFYDYDGTLVDSYSAEEFLQLSEMPKNPSHGGLVAQGWNWGLERAQSYVNKYGILDIGQVYITDDEATRLYIDIERAVELELNICINGTRRIDWGDGEYSIVSNGSLSETKTVTHFYQNKGSYIISLGLEGELTFPKSTSQKGEQYSTIFSIYDDLKDEREYIPSLLKAVYLGANIEQLTECCFINCYNMKTCLLPEGFKYLTIGCFDTTSIKTVIVPKSLEKGSTDSFSIGGAYRLEHLILAEQTPIVMGSSNSKITRLTLPESISIIGNSLCFNNIYLKQIVIPSTVTRILGRAFENTRSLKEVIIPYNVEAIGQSNYYTSATFAKSNIDSIKFESSVPPTIYHGDAFPSTAFLTIYVPQGSLESYINAQYYPNPAFCTYVEY